MLGKASKGRLIKNPAWVTAFGAKGNRGPQSALQKYNFDLVRDYNRGQMGIGPSWNS